VCTEGEAEDGEVDLLLLMGRRDDLGEIHDGLVSQEPGEASADVTGDLNRSGQRGAPSCAAKER
jgi:hypothetical protein